MSVYIRFEGKLYHRVVGAASVLSEPVEVVRKEKPEPKAPAIIRVPCPHADVLARHEAHCECLGDGFVLRPSPPSLWARQALEEIKADAVFGKDEWDEKDSFGKSRALTRFQKIEREADKALAALPELEARPCTFCLNKRSAERCSQCNGTGEFFVKVKQ